MKNKSDKVIKIKGTRVIGHIVRVNVPMLVTFDSKEAEFVANAVGQAIDMGYKVYHMFSQDKGDSNDPEFN
jgi:hypothetical protein